MPLILFLRMLSYWRAVNLEMVNASLRLLDQFEHSGEAEFLAIGNLRGQPVAAKMIGKITFDPPPATSRFMSPSSSCSVHGFRRRKSGLRTTAP